MDNPTFLGLKFRSPGHLFWFLLSLAGIAVTSLAAFWLTLHPRVGARPSAVWQYPFWSHFWVAVAGLVLTRAGTRQYRSFSIDCIWWNAVMASLYGAIMLVSRRLG